MRAVLPAIVLSLLVAPTAHAAGWSPTRAFAGAGTEQAAPRAAIGAKGASVVAWTRADRRLVASFGDARGRFGAPVIVARSPRDYAVADGAIAYEAADGVHVAIQKRHRFVDHRVATSTGSEINGVTIAADPLGGWVVAERQFPAHGSAKPYRVRVLSLDARGALVGTVQDLGLGQFGLDARPTQALAVLPDGRALLVFQREREQFGDPEPVVLAARPHGGAFGTPAPLGDGLTDPRVVVAGDRAVVAVTENTACGDAGCAGQPRAIPLASDLTPQAPVGPALENPNRAFAPWATPQALVFQLKTGVQPFSREAPVRASSLAGGGALQTLTSERATEPVALPLSGGRTLALWATRKALGAALAGADGRFTHTAAPAGPPPEPYHTNPTNRDARAAGHYVIAAWARAGVVRVSVRHV